MLQFEPYPIYIVYSLHRQQTIGRVWKDNYNQREAAKKRAVGDFFSMHWSKVKRDLEVAGEKDRMVDAAIQWQRQWEIEDDLTKYDKEAEAYQSKIKSILTTISHTSIGKQLLQLIGSDQKVYIIPQDSDGAATTRLASDEEGGGVRIAFSPQYFSNVSVGPGSAGPRSVGSAVEATLFHELVHAMRLARGRYFVRSLSSWDFNHSSEEFIAETLANVYHSSRGESDFYGTYQGGFLRKKEMYAYLEHELELVYALKFYLQTEQLAQFAAHLRQPDYNPFRDLKEIEDKSFVRMFTDDADSNPFHNK